MTDRERAVVAAVSAASSRPEWMTCDRIEALAGGHGMLNVPVICVANVLAQRLGRGADLEVRFANRRRQPIDDLLRACVDAPPPGRLTPA